MAGDSVLGADDADIEFAAAQSGDGNTVALHVKLDAVSRAAAVLQVLAQPFPGKPTKRLAVGERLLRKLQHQAARRVPCASRREAETQGIDPKGFTKITKKILATYQLVGIVHTNWLV